MPGAVEQSRTSIPVLIDHANLPPVPSRRDYVHLADTIINTISPQLPPAAYGFSLRLYDGWYRGQTLSSAAQRAIAAVSADFPYYRALSSTSSQRCLVTAELAHGPAFAPNVTFTHTYRERDTVSRLRVRPLPACSEPECSLKAAHGFLSTQRCKATGCARTLTNLIESADEQKLVDTLLVADLAHYSLEDAPAVVVVSADDDMWPGIAFALSRAKTVFSLLPKHANRVSPYRHLFPGSKFHAIALAK